MKRRRLAASRFDFALAATSLALVLSSNVYHRLRQETISAYETNVNDNVLGFLGSIALQHVFYLAVTLKRKTLKRAK